MKTFIIDKVLIFLVSGSLFILLFLLEDFSTKEAIKWVLGIIILWGLGCRELFLLPIDLLLGKSSKTCVFYSCTYVDKYEFFRKRYYFCYHFVVGIKDVFLLNPIAYKINDEVELPPKDKKIKITYYRLSKLLLSWEIEDEGTTGA